MEESHGPQGRISTWKHAKDTATGGIATLKNIALDTATESIATLRNPLKQGGREIAEGLGKALSVVAGFGSDGERKSLAVFEQADKCLLELLKEVPTLGLPQDEITVTSNQLSRREFPISAFGRHNVGKSTLLNAVLGDRLLPIHMFGETGVSVKIEHCKDLRSSEYPKLIVLEPETGAKAISSGADDILKALRSANQESRSLQQVSSARHFQYVLCANVRVLRNDSAGRNIFMVDNPGFGEANQEYIERLTTTSLRTSAAFLYILSVNQLQDQVDALCFKLLHEKDKDIFTNQRIVIAVTHFDTTYSLLMPDLRVDRKTVVTKVTDDIKAVTGVTVPPDIVVTVSGTWALAARQLRNSPDNAELRRGVMLALEGSPEIARDEIKGLSQLSSTDLAKKLEIASGITKLEQSIQRMTSRCSAIWEAALTANYMHYLTQAHESLTKEVDVITDEYRRMKNDFDVLSELSSDIAETRGNLEKSLDMGSAQCVELKQKCHEDVEYTMGGVKQLLKEFMEICKDKMDEGFDPGQYREERTKLVGEEVALISEGAKKFVRTWEALQSGCNRAKADLDNMRKAAEKFINTATTNSTGETQVPKTITLEDVFDRGTETLEDAVEVALEIPELDCPCLWKTYSKWRTVERSAKQLEDFVLTWAAGYLNVEDQVTKVFFHSYQEYVRQQLDLFDTEYLEMIEKLRNKAESEVKSLDAKKSKLEDLKSNVDRSMSHLEKRKNT